MIIHTENIGQVKQICDHFSIPINTAELELSFPLCFPFTHCKQRATERRLTSTHSINLKRNTHETNTLEHGTCTACAVGNIIASSVGAKVVKDEMNWIRNSAEIIPIWDEVFLSSLPKMQDTYPENYKGWAKRQIDTTGYSWRELARIEYAFECHSPLLNERYGEGCDDTDSAIESECMFNGLMAVVDVLAEIHNVDLSVREEAKLLFVKP